MMPQPLTARQRTGHVVHPDDFDGLLTTVNDLLRSLDELATPSRARLRRNGRGRASHW